MKHFNLLKTTLLLCALIVGSLSGWAQSDKSSDYTGNITLSTAGGSNASSCLVVVNKTNYNGIKAGTSSKVGAVKISVPQGTKYLHLHAAGWNGENVTLAVSPTGYSENISLSANSGISGNSPFTFSGSPNSSDYYKVITFTTALAANTDLTFTATGGKRFVIWGVTSEEAAAASPLASIALSGSYPTSFHEGDAFSHEGMVVTATYDDASTKNVTTSASFSGYDMNSVSNQEVTVSYAEGNITKTAKYNITVSERPTYTVTITAPTGGTLVVKNGDDVVASGDKFIAGTVLSVTATPSDDYNFVNWKAVDASTHIYTAATSYTMTEHDVTLSATFAAKVYHNAIFKKNGGEIHATVPTEVGKTIVFPATEPAAVDGKVFVGWVAATIAGATDEAPTFVTSATMSDEDVTYYACYADVTPGSSTTKTDELTTSTFGDPASYGDWENKHATSGSDAVYAGNTTTNNGAIQMRSKENSGVVSTVSGGQVKKVTATWNSSTTAGRTLDIYGKNSAYSSSSDLYSSTPATLGTKIGSIVCGTSTELNIVGDYTYIGVRSKDGAMYLDEIDVDWLTGTPDTYSGYCTTVAADTREAVNITSFTATETTLIKGNTTATAVANDQAGWTAAYTYASDNTDVATVAADGVITAVGKGIANITATLNVDKDDANYKKGTTFSKSIEITVNNPSHTVAFYDNGTKISEENVEEEAAIVFPTNPTPAVGGFVFEGWATAVIDGTAAVKPATVTEANMGDADINYYAVYVEKRILTAVFNASDITKTPAVTNESLTWKDTATDITLKLSAGQRYTSGTPNTWSVTSGTSHYFEITTNGRLTSITTTITESKYKINSVSAGTLTTNGTTQTINSFNNASSVRCYATSGNQIRATEIVVNAESEPNGYVTTLPTDVTVSISSAGWATYSSNYPLDFTGITALTAYTASKYGSAVKFNKVTGKVPANTGLLVRGETANVPVCASADPVTNLLVGVTAETVKDANTVFVLMKGSKGIGFYKNTNAFTLRANSAYLPAEAVPTTDARAFIALDDETTGIADVKAVKEDAEGMFDLQGRKVAKPTKGLYIVNGKKIVVK